ncbi:MAG: rod shape-determining protein MreC [Methylophilaceae bacterium]|jgi:rod shape-determining protein MreC
MLLSAKKRKGSSLFNKSKTSINLTLVLFIINFFIFSANQESIFLKSIKRSLNLTPYSLSFFLDNLSNGIDSVLQYFHFKKTLIEENHNLQNQLYLLNNQILLQENLILDNQELQNKLEIKEKYFDHSVIAKILKINYSGKNHHFLINKGQSDQIQAGHIVVDDKGILGQVIDVQTDRSTVKTIRSKDFYLTGYILINSKPYQTLVQGNNQNLTINYFSKNIPIQIGDSIFTTGDDVFIPEDVRIGKVAELQPSELKDFYKVIIKPASNPNQQKYLIVLK